MFYTNPKVVTTGCYARKQAAYCEPTYAPSSATVPSTVAAGPPRLIATSRSVSIQSIEYNVRRESTTKQTSAIYGAFINKPSYSTRQPMESAFPSLKNPKKPKVEGITIINVHNENNNNITSKFLGESSGPKAIKCSEQPHSKNNNKGKTTLRIERTQSDEALKGKPLKPTKINCVATNSDRQIVFGSEKPILPYWHREEPKSKDLSNQYDCEKAKREWDRFYNQNTKENKKESLHKDSNSSPTSPGGTISAEMNSPRNPQKKEHPMAKDLPKKKKYQIESPTVPDSAASHLCRPFYGTTETARISELVVGHLVRAEKELRRLEFTTGSVLPQTKTYIAGISSIHEDLKMFNTNFRELQQQTDETLKKTIVGEMKITLKKPAVGQTQIPSSSRQKNSNR